jgi:hypothetical protein
MSIIAGWASHRNGFDKSLFISRQAKPKYVLTARQLWKFVLPGAATGNGVVPLGPGGCPGTRRVWRVFLLSGYKLY